MFLDRWDWKNREDLVDTIELTQFVDSYQWRKVLVHPASQGVVTARPQTEDAGLMDLMKPMDVVRIYENGKLRSQGFLRTIGYRGAMAQGQPQRSIQFTYSGFGSYLTDATISVDLDIFRGSAQLLNSALKLAESIVRAGKITTYYALIDQLVREWFTFIQTSISSTVHTKYISRYVNFLEGVTKDNLPGYPKEVWMYYGTEDQLTLWSILEKLTEAPFFEMFIDDGPRAVRIDGTDVNLTGDYSYLIGRRTPYNRTVEDGVLVDRFDDLTPITVPFQNLISFDLNRSMDDVSSAYLVPPASYHLSELELKAAGQVLVDPYLMKKYLYKVLRKELYFIRGMDADNTQTDPYEPIVRKRVEDLVATMSSWYGHNDEFLSGAFRYMESNNPEEQPKIGDRLKIEDVDGDFYVQAVDHTWSYGGILQGTATVTRGWNYATDSPVELKDRIFRKLPYYSRTKEKFAILKRGERDAIPTE